MSWSNKKYLLILQLAATMAIIALTPSNVGKIGLLILVWVVTFRQISKREIWLYVISCLIFTVVDMLAVKRGLFYFINPDIWGLPLYQPLMWGYFVLHFRKFLEGGIPNMRPIITLPLLLAFVASFFFFDSEMGILASTSLILVAFFLILRDKTDLLYFTYAIFIGFVFEFIGIKFGQWGYISGALPLWFLTLWGGSLVFSRRIIFPLFLV